ncbi:MAG: phospho-N-acetylmuramoyl-pentapeptide-transferase [Candidatus Nanopelagicales bacterium]|jgi:phospho-N-acetylmuramoyl-pentapeptide-transferase|nr:phospho-N-acetylmuramoyl-pentapeptide-transferase [Candidatus Nanopelagicales bacterium]
MIQIVLSAIIAALVALLGTPLLIKVLTRRNLAQAIRESADGIVYPEHSGKKGTPSMGGLAIVIAVLLGYFGSHLIRWTPPTPSGLLAVYLMVGLALVGFADDYLKVFKSRSGGVRARTKLLGQAAVALSFAYLATRFPDDAGLTPASQAISVVRDTAWVLPLGLFLLWIWFIVTAITNGVNLSDGLDGLAAGASVLVFGGYTLVNVWQFGQSCSVVLTQGCYVVRDPLDLATFAVACAGACFGFLWWNTSPAHIFMGDTGSLALGGGMAALAIMSRTEMLFVLMGGLFVIITLSVIAQVGSFKLTGRRVLRMAPLHHHFEMAGWQEITIVVRFWLIQGLCLSAGLALFYAEWIRG